MVEAAAVGVWIGDKVDSSFNICSHSTFSGLSQSLVLELNSILGGQEAKTASPSLPHKKNSLQSLGFGTNSPHSWSKQYSDKRGRIL